MLKKNTYNKTQFNSRELVYMYAKICNLKENEIINERYKILKYLGRGGFGIVYKCFDNVLNTEVAIKFLDPMITRDPKKFHRIKREINISRKITDNRIVKIFTMEKHFDVIFLVMEFIDGIPLSEIIKNKDYKWEEFKPILIEILNGLKFLHKNEIIHRDLKPGNIMILKNNNIKIVDFGLAKEITDMEKTSTTEEFSGTAEFVSPEQVEGEVLDAQSDIYQIGIITFLVLSGQHPFSSTSTMELLVKYLTVKPKKISEFKKDIPEYAKFVIGKMLERKKKDRFADVDEIIEILNQSNVKTLAKLLSLVKKNSLKITLIGIPIAILLFYLII